MILPHPIALKTSSKAEKEKGLENDYFCTSTLRYSSLVLCPRQKKNSTIYDNGHDCETT